MTYEERKPWHEYPLGTKAYAIQGDHWEKVQNGWKWCAGATYPTPGADVSRVEVPVEAELKALKEAVRWLEIKFQTK